MKYTIVVIGTVVALMLSYRIPYVYSYTRSVSSEQPTSQTLEHQSSQPTLYIPVRCEPYVKYILDYPWNWQTAINVMYQESSCNPDEANEKDTHVVKRDYKNKQLWYCIGSYGLFEDSCIYPVYYDPKNNIATAYAIYKEQGWNAWLTTCTTKITCNK